MRWSVRLAWLISLLFVCVCAGCSSTPTANPPTSNPGFIHEVQAAPAPREVDADIYRQLKEELVRVLNERGVSKITATPPLGAANVVSDLAVTDLGGAMQLTWTHRCSGDYNNDGEVTVSDLTPVGIYYNAKTGDANWDLASAADGNGDGFITVSDITAIGQNYGVATRGYTIFASGNVADYPAGADDANGNGTNMIDSAAFSTAVTNAANRREFSYTIGFPNPGDVYWVRPYDDAAVSGARSALGQVGGVGTVDLDIDPNGANQPTAGAGTIGDPYIVDQGEMYDTWIFHSVDGNVTSDPATSFASSNPTATVTANGVVSVGATAAHFNISATYLGLTDTVYFTAVAAGSATFGMNPANPALGGTGTSGDPYQLDTLGSFALQVIDTSGPTDVTGQGVFTISDPGNIQVDPTGFIIVDALFNGTFNIQATFNSVATVPDTLYFTVSGGGPNDPPSALFDFVSASFGQAPFDLTLNASASSDTDGTIVQYEWDVWGNSDFDVTTTGPLLEYSYHSLTLKDVTLRVTDNGGEFGEYTHPTQLDIANANPVSVPQISSRGLHDCAIAEIDGLANIATTGANYVDFHRSTDALGTAFSSEQDLDSGGGGLVNHQAVAVDAYFTDEVVAYAVSDSGFDPAEPVARFVKALNGDGTGWQSIGTNVDYYSNPADIAVQTVDNGINVYQVDENGRMLCFRSSDGGATYPAEYAVEGSLTLLPDFAVYFLNTPICAYAESADGALYFRQAQDNAGTNWSASASLIQNTHYASSIELTTANGVPAVVYVDLTNHGSGSTPIYYSYAYDADGTSWSDPQELADPGWTVLRKIAFTKYLLKPVVIYQDGNDLMMRRAHDRLGTRWSEPYTVRSSVDTRNPCVAQVSDNLFIAYNKTTDGGATSDGTECAVIKK